MSSTDPALKREGHLKKASENLNQLNKMIDDSNPSSDWIITVAFYRALHLLEAGAIGKPPKAGIPKVENHEARREYVKRTRSTKDIWKNYLKLDRASRTARYDVDGSMEKYELDVIQDKLLNTDLRAIEQWCQKRLQKEGIAQDYLLQALQTTP